MAKKIDTLNETAALFFGDWEDAETGCAARTDADGTHRFVITDAAKHAEYLRREHAKATATEAENMRQAIAQADDC